MTTTSHLHRLSDAWNAIIKGCLCVKSVELRPNEGKACFYLRVGLRVKLDHILYIVPIGLWSKVQ